MAVKFKYTLTEDEVSKHYSIILDEFKEYLQTVFWPPARGAMGNILKDISDEVIGYWYEIQILFIYFRFRVYDTGVPFSSLSLNFSRYFDDRNCQNARAHIYVCFKLINIIITLGILTPRFDKSHKYVIDLMAKKNQGERNG